MSNDEDTTSAEYLWRCLVNTIARREPGQIAIFLDEWERKHKGDTRLREDVRKKWFELRQAAIE